MKSKQEIITSLKKGKTINEVCYENKLSLNQLMRITRTRTTPKLPKNIIRRGKRYRIRRQTANKVEYYGSFITLEEAKNALDLLIKNNWNIEPCEYMGLLYIVQDKKGWKIQKFINGKLKHIKYFENLDDAIKVRDKLVKFDWDLDYLPLILKQVGVEKIGN